MFNIYIGQKLQSLAKLISVCIFDYYSKKCKSASLCPFWAMVDMWEKSTNQYYRTI